MTEKPRETQAESHVVELKEKVNNSSLMKHHASGQSVAPGANHRTAQLVQPRPDRLIALETKLTLQSQSTNPIFLAGDQPHGQEPELQRLPRPLEKGPRRDGCLTMAGRTFPQTLSSRRPSSVHFTFRTSKTVRPPKALQIGTTILVSLKTPPKLNQICRIILPFHQIASRTSAFVVRGRLAEMIT